MHAQSNTTTTTDDDGVVLPVSANVTDAANTIAGNTTVSACPLTEEALAGVDLMNASMACAGKQTASHFGYQVDQCKPYTLNH
jgi:hypothetical protein